jgi:hypothetical protein
MPVHPSRRANIGALIARLSDSDAVERESAAARLIVIGERAGPALQALLDDTTAPSAARISALRTLAAALRKPPLASAAAVVVDADISLALDAIELLGEVLSDTADAGASDRALDHLTRLALDTSVPERQRLAVMDRLSRLPARLRQPVFDALSDDDNPTIATRARDQHSAPRGRLEHWSDDEHLPSTPDAMADAIDAEGEQTPITTLRRLIDLIRSRERASSDTERDAWRSTRGLLHDALARRGSVLALYDLRETLEQVNQPVGAHFLSAAMTVADAACLDAIAVRWVHAAQDIWLRDQLERIFHAVVIRERLRRQSPVLAKVLTRHPSAGPLVATAPRTRPPGR